MVCPKLRGGSDPDNLLAIQGGRHPVLDVLMDGACVPNDFALSAKVPFALVTGPNCKFWSLFVHQREPQLHLHSDLYNESRLRRRCNGF
jgi:hypothetical protein